MLRRTAARVRYDSRVNSLEKMLSLLDLFTPATAVWSTEGLLEATGCTRSTGYRYIKTLQDFGYLAPVGNGSYILGPRVLELDRTTRLTDAVYNAGGTIMKALSERTGHSALLCVLYKDSVMCVRDELAPNAPPGIFGRGQKRPLFAGAASKVILAHLPSHQLRSLFDKHGPAIAAAGLGSTWEEFRSALRAIRDKGFCITRGEFTAGITGISAPLFNAEGAVLGSLGIAGRFGRTAHAQLDELAGLIVQAARETSTQIARAKGINLPARAVG